MSVVLFGLFLLFVVGQGLTGVREYNAEQRTHDEPTVTFGEYLTTAHFGEALFENWESEFLQMAGFVLFTVFLRQKGSAESKQPYGEEDVDQDPRESRRRKDVPWPVRRGGLILKLYENSLFLAFALLFLLSFWLHGIQGAHLYNGEQREHREPTVTTAEYFTTARFWFESFQNWQSEFLAVGSMALFSVYLRQRGSTESKPVDMPHAETAG